LKTVHLPSRLEPSDFSIRAGTKASNVKVRVIDQVTDLVTREHIASLPVTDGEIRVDVTRDLLKVAAVDRKFSPGKTFVGLVRGFGMKAGALASSAAWDTTDIIVVGQNDEDMALAVNRIRDLQGGALICAHGQILAEIPLPVFGLLSQLSLRALAKTSEEITKAARGLGCPFQDPLRTLVTLTGAAIPFLRICEEGLVDIKSGKTMGLIVERMG
ncbi:MAG: adenine deaminase, partial [Desulfobacterales bacterium]|nr:adenine deaminase [Desulfobacterales bacterium]